MAYDRLIRATDDPDCKETLNYLMSREIAHQRMFVKALESLGGQMEGVVKPEYEVNTYYNLSRSEDGDSGLGTDERGPWNQGDGWEFSEKPEETLNFEVHGPKSK